MCGIGGVLRIHDPAQDPLPPPHAAIPEAWLDVLDASVRHRGPDGQGRFRDRVVRADGRIVDVALVHRRLSIIDHGGGGQPMAQGVPGPEAILFGPAPPDATAPGGPGGYRPVRAHVCARCHELARGGVGTGRGERRPVPAGGGGRGEGAGPSLLAIVFNGCIYNHRELRRELEGAGHEFWSDHADTEVLLHGWREWGHGLIRRLDGMFAAAVWDGASGELSLLRDDFGEKPLYVLGMRGQGEGLGGFASSAAGLFRLKGAIGLRVWSPGDDPRGMRGWVKFGWSRNELDSSFGECLVGWSFSPWGGTDEHGVAPACERVLRDRTGRPGVDEVDQLLRDSVRSRLEADVPIGCFLSGGIDSALIARYASEFRSDLTAFSVRMPDAAFDESSAAAETARHLGLRHEILGCEAEPAADLIRLIREVGLPFGDSSLLPTHWVSRAARSRARVALTGDGGDEMFLGYDRHRVLRVLSRLGRLHRLLRSKRLPSLGEGANPKSWRTRAARIAGALGGEGYKELTAIFPPPFDRRLGLCPYRHDGMTFFDEVTALRFDLMFSLPLDLMRKVDTAAMSVALETRAPMLARGVSERAMSSEVGGLMPRGRRKGLLRAVARKYLPREIVDRSKQGFAIPVGEWFRSDYGGMRQLLYDHLESADPFPALPAAGVDINMSVVRHMLREHDAAGERSLTRRHGRDHSQRLYMLLVLSIWSKWLAGLG